MAISIVSKEKCTGCSSCANICPQNCISMQEDEEGFFYPVNYGTECINCELCMKACPMLNKPVSDNLKLHIVYGAKTKEDALRFKSSSGGMFTSFARGVIQDGGIVVGAAYKTPFYVAHTFAKDLSEIEVLAQSKYVQSSIENVYCQIKKELQDGNTVFMCGTPCQVSGLYTFLGTRPEKLITCDFICMGVSSPKAYREWLKEYEYENSEVTKVWFNYKEKGWHASAICTRIDFKDSQSVILDKDSNSYMNGYVCENLFIRPSCGSCQFKILQNVSDITIGDFRGLNPELDDDKGTSVVILHSTKGVALFERIKQNLLYWESDIDSVLCGNHMITTSVNINKKSTEFLCNLNKKSFSALYEEYMTMKRNKQLEWLKNLRVSRSKKYEQDSSNID